MKKFINTSCFLEQIEELHSKYRKIREDYTEFLESFSIEQGTDLGKGFYKFRIKNSSIPVGKRGGFRVIFFAPKEKIECIPVCIYSKTERDDVTFSEILHKFAQIVKERTKK